MKLDVIVLEDNWKEVQLINFSEYDLSPPFDNPDFRCNQLSIVKQAEPTKWPYYKLKSNWAFIPHVFEHNADGIIACISEEIKNIQREADNLKIITDDIIAKRAIPVISTRLVAPYRIVKMEKKGYTVDIVSMLPKQLVHKAPLLPDDKCIICFEEFKSCSIMLKPCECSGLMHAVCWAQFVKMENTNHRYHNRCPNCRNQQDICIRYSENVNTCKLTNMLSALEHYQTDVEMRPFRAMVCNMCTRTHRDTYNYEQDDVD
jgi:TusA-related sulfurtransferase